MPMSLTALPPELVSCVVANITSKLALCNLARCSRQLYLCTIPHLYRHVTIQEEIRQGEKQKEELKTLASLLIRRSDLAGLVRHFTLHVVRARAGWYYPPKDHEESHDQAFITAVNGSSLSDEEKIKCLGQFSHTHQSHHDLILALLLPALLKVEKVVLRLNICRDTHYLEDMIRRAACREKQFEIQPPFEALTVFILSHDVLNARSTGFISSLLKLPAIQEISGGFESTWHESDDWGNFPFTDKNLKELDSSSSPLTSLDLAHHRLNAADLGHILRAPQALKTFFFKFCHFPAGCVELSDMRPALGPQENHLESLDLDCDKAYDRTTSPTNHMESFISFNALKVFKTVAIFLTKTVKGTGRHSLINIFPPNLETLHLTRFQARFESLLEALEHLLAQKSPQQIPSLKTLILEEFDYYGTESGPWFGPRPAKLMHVLWKDTQETAIGRLSEVAAAQGVSIDVIGEDSSIGEWDEFFGETDESDESSGGE